MKKFLVTGALALSLVGGGVQAEKRAVMSEKKVENVLVSTQGAEASSANGLWVVLLMLVVIAAAASSSSGHMYGY